MGHLIRAVAVWGFDDVVRELGGHPAALRARFGLPAATEDPDETFVSYEAFTAMVEAVAVDLDCPDVGLRISERQGMTVLGPIAVIARNADTAREGIEAIARFLPTLSTALRLSLVNLDDGGVRLRYEVTARSVADLHQPYELAMSNATQIVRLLSGGTAGPTTLWLPHSQISPTAVYERHFGCPVVFDSGFAGLAVGPEVLARPIDAADPQTRRVATAYLASRHPDVGLSFAERVSDLVRRLLPTGHHSADVVAEQLHLHRRTLQRRLLEEGTTYAELLDTQRRSLAVHYLARPEMQIGQIAVLLGYTEQSAFNRAFRRWFATSPRDYRRPIRHPAQVTTPIGIGNQNENNR